MSFIRMTRMWKKEKTCAAVMTFLKEATSTKREIGTFCVDSLTYSLGALRHFVKQDFENNSV